MHPLDYAALWGWLLALLLLGPVAVLIGRRVSVAVLRFLRRPPTAEQRRERCVRMIAETAASHELGTISAREAHGTISRAVRDFVAARTSAHTLTLAELEATDAPEELLRLIRGLYDGVFAAQPQTSVADTARDAERLVRAWN